MRILWRIRVEERYLNLRNFHADRSKVGANIVRTQWTRVINGNSATTQGSRGFLPRGQLIV